MTHEPTQAAPCPFCGGFDLYMHSYLDNPEPDAFVQCHGCTAMGPGAPTEAEAIERWNKRKFILRKPPPDSLVDEVLRSGNTPRKTP